MSEPARQLHANDLDSAYRELRPVLVRYAESMLGSHVDAEDAVQEAFIAAGRSGPIEDLRPWLFRVTRNAVISFKRKRRPTVWIDEGLEPQDPRSVQGDVELSEQLSTLRACIDRLPERGRSALMLRELAGLSYCDIAQAIDTSEANVKVLIFRARRDVAELSEAADLRCEDAQRAISQRADGELARRRAARAAVHAATCRHCRRFSHALSSQRRGLAALFPIVPVGHIAAVAAHVGGAAGGCKAAAGGGSLVGPKLAALAAAATLTAGSVAVLHGGQAVRSDLFGHRTYVRALPPPAATAGTGEEGTAHGPGRESEAAASAGSAESESSDATPATSVPAAAPASSEGESTVTAAVFVSNTTSRPSGSDSASQPAELADGSTGGDGGGAG